MGLLMLRWCEDKQFIVSIIRLHIAYMYQVQYDIGDAKISVNID